MRPAATRGALIAGLTLLLAACAATPPERPSLPAEDSAATESQPSLEEQQAARRDALMAMTSWRVKGKVAYRLPDDAGSASLDWQQDGEQTQLRLSGPLGVGSTRIRNDGALLRVRRDGIDRLYPADGAPWLPGGALLPIPVASFQYWLRGLPDPALPVEAIEQEDLAPLYFQQNGWKVFYESYESEEVTALPARIELQAPAADLSLRLILRDWDLRTSDSSSAE